MFIFYFLIYLVLGYLIGRTGHYYWGYINTFHHWVTGLFIVILGLFFLKNNFGLYIISFGIGNIISDLKDMFNLEIYGPDKEKNRTFWGFD